MVNAYTGILDYHTASLVVSYNPAIRRRRPTRKKEKLVKRVGKVHHASKGKYVNTWA